MEEIKVSVIIPVYRVERFIERCARSLFEQTMRSGIEFIFVDDCSPDSSIEILRNTLKDYPHRKAYVTILTHPANKGLAATRKTGVRAARGQYIIHCDSDDWVEPDMYAIMYEEATRSDADIVVCNYFDEYESSSNTAVQNFSPIKRNQLIDLLDWNLHCMVWMRMFRRSFYITFALDTPDLNRGEDFPVSFLAHALGSKISYINKPLYHYNRTNQGSISASTSAKEYNDSVLMLTFLRQFIYSQPEDKAIQAALNRQLARIRNKILRFKEIYDLDRWSNLWPELKLKDCMNFRSKVLMTMARLRLNLVLKLFLKENIR